MLYTIGFTKSYESNFTEGYVRKLGKGKDHKGNPYAGGAVFESIEQANQYLQNHNLIGYSVYGLATTLENTEQLEGEPHRRLLTSCNITRL